MENIQSRWIVLAVVSRFLKSSYIERKSQKASLQTSNKTFFTPPISMNQLERLSKQLQSSADIADSHAQIPKLITCFFELFFVGMNRLLNNLYLEKHRALST